MKYRVTHTTEFTYKSQVGLCYNEARLLPRDLPHQKVLSAALRIDPSPDDHYERYDYFGNRTAYFSSSRHPGVVLRVSQTWQWVCFTFWT